MRLTDNHNFGKLKVSAVDIINLALTSGTAVTSDKIPVNNNKGQFCLTIKEDISGGAGDVDIYAEYSDDDVIWGRPYISDLAGITTVEGNIVTTLQNVTKKIYFQARFAKYIRFVFDPDADSQITVSFAFQENNV